MPVSAFDYGDAFYKQHGVYQRSAEGPPVPSTNAYRRLSFFDPLAQERIRQLYRDLATYANFQGVLFHDDALLDADEDFHPFARKWYAKHGLSTEDYAQWKNDPAQRTRFTLLKMQALDAFIQSLVQVVREQRPDIRTARNLYAATALDAGSVNWLAQDLDQALEQYDHVALMAMPWMEQAADPAQWTTNLIAVLSRLSPLQRDKLVVELQTRDWRTDQPVDKAAFQEQVLLWKRAGYRNFAWYPDDFIANVPDFNLVFRLLSLEDYPYEAR
jgi:biofilm PGA synthesis lipoprotein PgaB